MNKIDILQLSSATAVVSKTENGAIMHTLYDMRTANVSW